ncbi:ImmA/IrrE family metallo-endopeptidase [Actinomycetospora soli]|uniref:ImmA/IrrE family metallo-endopeptidase n=1 Tax=Actinomycetospora soli TaxID=2893887 RepID=UPI001E297A3E|nr:ImmA/IrrE family metallo-endopeptidase [Actinomycetospora soli]MCD2191367.1 ImmA/IrrE family metallo-endopeptidase [Actinomycetospora soli]
MRRGFKAQAERHAAELRTAANCSDLETIHLPRLAFHLKVGVLAGHRVLGDVQPFLDLHAEQPGAFSGATFHMDDGRIVVIYNPVIYETGDVLTPQRAQTHGRTRSDVAHEFSHLVLGHTLREVKSIAGHPFLSCDPEQEEEANWLAGCLLLPRPLLLKAARDQEADSHLAERTHTTVDMARWRMNATGARMQAARGRGQRA